MRISCFLAFLPVVASVFVPPNQHSDHEHLDRRALPKRWFQDEEHSARSLFKRATDDGVDYPTVGSAEWRARYPRDRNFDVDALPQEWVDALAEAVEAGRIPDIPRTTMPTADGNPVYPPQFNPVSINVCSTTYKCVHPEDIWDAPAGVFSSSFDDGPYPTSGRLIEFLAAHNVRTTHFMIGVHILAHPDEFMDAFEGDNDLAVHTWSHLRMTTLDNLNVLGQLGWTMQVIHDSTGGRVPRYWRPPYGDSDNRVRAIAKEVFGMDTVIWNQDPQDWRLAAGQTTAQAIHAQIEGWLQGPKTTGLMVLQHEITDGTVDIFMSIFPLIAQNGWEFESVASCVNDGRSYQNAEGSQSDDVVLADILALPDDDSDPSTTDSEGDPSETAGPNPTNTKLAPTLSATHAPLAPTPDSNPQSTGSRNVPSLAVQAWTVSLGLGAAVLLL
ncbi:glycoside hydrolase/deacetylase [Coprinopsis marcescibilis]|uniref:chitin deacetylase n=1 Tax=Coprinopsis marcescibilis TaxID=230819 RepID=A0A5C3L6U4_COPMA|nr:glycoside hydrolase/deacetylase [Coprinopsis marcescibilis]